MRTRYGCSPWVDRFPKSRVPTYPKHHGTGTIDVVIVGGGLTGCAAAYVFAAAGVRVALVEADGIGRGRSSAACGWIGTDPGVAYSVLQEALGARTARHAFRAWRRAALDLTALVRRLQLKCNLEPAAASIIGLTPNQVASLRRERKARLDAGLEATWLTGRMIAASTGLTAGGGIGTREGATIDPYRAAIGFASAAVQRGANVFEHSAVRKITFTRRVVDVFTEEGSIRARKVLVATGAPTALFASLARHFWFRSAYLALSEPVPARIRNTLGKRSTVVRDSVAPSHLVRWVDNERLLVSGADGTDVPPRLREKTVVQRTGQLMYELSTMYPDISGIMPAYGWQVPYARTADGLPYIGPHRNFPHHLFAFGDSSRSVTGAYLAGRILLRHYRNELDDADGAFGFNR